jgi:hypothetical protein
MRWCSALHQLDDAIFDELVDEILTPINVSRPLSVTWVLGHRDNCTRVHIQVHRPQLRESKLTHDDTQVQKLLISLAGSILLAFSCTERHTLLFHRLPPDRPAIHHYNVACERRMSRSAAKSASTQPHSLLSSLPSILPSLVRP